MNDEVIDLVAKKVYDFEKTQHEMTDSEYISFLCSTNSLFGNNTEDETNTRITELPNDNNDFLQYSLFGIHMTGTNDALSTDNPHISIGWSGMGDLSQSPHLRIKQIGMTKHDRMQMPARKVRI